MYLHTAAWEVRRRSAVRPGAVERKAQGSRGQEGGKSAPRRGGQRGRSAGPAGPHARKSGADCWEVTWVVRSRWETMNRLRRPSAAPVTAFECGRLQFRWYAARLPDFAPVLTTPAEIRGRASTPPRMSSSYCTNFASLGIYTRWMLSVFKSAKHSRSIVACRYAFTPWARTL